MTDDRFPPDENGRRRAMVELNEGPDDDGFYCLGTYEWQRIHDDELHDLPAQPPEQPGWAAAVVGPEWHTTWGNVITDHGLDWMDRTGLIITADSGMKPVGYLLYPAREPVEPSIRPEVQAVIDARDVLTLAERAAVLDAVNPLPVDRRRTRG